MFQFLCNFAFKWNYVIFYLLLFAFFTGTIKVKNFEHTFNNVLKIIKLYKIFIFVIKTYVNTTTFIQQDEVQFGIESFDAKTIIMPQQIVVTFGQSLHLFTKHQNYVTVGDVQVS